jgi:hypothetical protein
MNLSEQNSSSTEIYKSSFNYTNLSVSSNTPIHNESNFKINHNQDEAILPCCDITNVKEFSSSPGSGQVKNDDERQSLLCHDEKDSHDNNNGIVIKDNVKSCDREDAKLLEQHGENNDENLKESRTKMTTSLKSLKKTKMTTETLLNSQNSIKLVKEPSLKLKKKKSKKANRKSNASSSSSSSFSTLIRNFFSCSVSCYSCNRLNRHDHKNNSIKSQSSNENAAIAMPANKSTQQSFKKIDQVIQYSSTESIINKFDGLKKKEKTVVSMPVIAPTTTTTATLINTNTSNSNISSEKTSNSQDSDIKRDNRNQLNSSVRRKPKIKKQCSIVDENYGNSTNDPINYSTSNNNTNNNVTPTRIILPILKINDTELNDVDVVSFDVEKKTSVQETGSKRIEYLIG